MRVIFLPDAGFHGNGGFVEVEDGADIDGSEEVYQRQGFLTLRLKCRNITIIHGAGVRNEMTSADADPAKRSSIRTISATGDIQESRWGQHRLSMLGCETTHASIDVVIRDHPDAEAVAAAGMRGNDDLDVKFDERFFVEVVITKERMDVIMRELQIPGSELSLDVKIWNFPGFYATWSPAIDEGRTVKFLDRERDVENADDIPEDFWKRDLHRKLLTDADSPPVNVAVHRRL